MLQKLSHYLYLVVFLDMGNELSKLNKQVSYLLSGFDKCYFKDGKSTPYFQTETWQLQLKKIMNEHYEE